MPIFNRWALTDEGKKLITKAQANRSAIKFTMARAGDGLWENGEDLRTATAIRSQKQEFSFSGIDIPDGNLSTVVLEITMHNRGLQELYFITELGIYAEGSDGEEILYLMLASDKRTIYMPAENGIGVSNIVERVNLEVADSANVTVNMQGALVSATDFLGVKKIVEMINNGLLGGKTGQHPVKTGKDDFQIGWEDGPVVTDPYEDFPKTGSKNILYVDIKSSELYVWLNDKYFKLPLGAEASTTLQKQITENGEAIGELKRMVDKTEAVFDYCELTVPASGWQESVEDDITVYRNEIAVKGLTEDTWAPVWPHTIATTAAGIVAEQAAQAVFFGKGKAYADAGKLVLKCFKRVPTVDFGIKLQGVV